MEEYTNDTMEAEDSFDDFIDFSEEETSPAEAEAVETEEGSKTESQAESQTESQAESQKEAEAVTPAAPEETFTLKYNGEEHQIGRAEMITLAQKGMNYDKILQERDRLRNSPEVQLLDRYARMNGMSREQYMEALQQAEIDRAVQAEVAKGVPEETAKQLVALQSEKRRMEAETEKRQSADAQKQRIRDQVAEFRREYPDVKEFPAEVLEKIKGGEHPVSAYRAYEIAQLKADMARLQEEKAAQAVTEKNRQKAVGSVVSVGAANDPLEDAFDSVFG